MGDSLPPPVAIDLIDSYARVSERGVEIVLARPTLGGTKGLLVLTKGRKVVQAKARLRRDGDGPRLVGYMPRRQLADGTWSIALRSPAGVDQVMGVRLLVQGERPLVLLWGAEGQQSLVPVRRLLTPKRRVAIAASRGLDELLAKLPPEQADHVRVRARKAARRILR